MPAATDDAVTPSSPGPATADPSDAPADPTDATDPTATDPVADPTPATTPATPPDGAYVPCSGTPVPALALQPVLTNVASPIALTSAPNDAADLFVALRDGDLLRVDGGTGDAETLLSLTVDTTFEGGFLGIALHPDYDGTTNGRLFVSYTEAGTGGSALTSVLEEYDTLASGGPALVRELLRYPQPAANHNAGNLAFGPDGYLYMSLGDGGGANNGPLAQDNTEPLGSILRFDVDDLQTPPVGNLAGPNDDSRIFHFGLRNPWRFSFDRLTGDLFVADVGQNSFEEVSVLPAGSPSTDFGWPMLEGFADFLGGDTGTSRLPIFAYDCGQFFGGGGQCSVTGGYVYRGQTIPGLYGRYIFADYARDQVVVMTWQADDPTTFCDQADITADLTQGGAAINGPASFGQDANGELYILALDGGVVYRIVAE